MKFLAFDIETAKITPPEDDIQTHRPLGICCWAVAWVVKNHKNPGIETVHGYNLVPEGKGPKMTVSECALVVSRLKFAVDNGYTLLTHNGVGFDLDILAEESGLYKECADLAMNSVDTCFQIHCMKGFPVGLEAICKGMGIEGKVEGMSGALAPQMWAEGKYDEVLAYVAQDVRATLEMALAVERQGGLHWIAKSGKRNWLRVPSWLTVSESLQLAEPNTSWMDTPIPRSRFTDWMAKAQA